MSARPNAELLLCDTSFVAALAAQQARRGRSGQWPRQLLARIRAAVLAISVVTLAEARFGYLRARIEREEQRLSALVHVPLDATTVDEWARLKDASERSGWNVGDNDLWIAATASGRALPLVTCDADHNRMTVSGLDVIYLPIEP